MTSLLLDTHAFIWFAMGDSKHMPAATADLIKNPSRDVYVSSASIWEIATKSRLGKLLGVNDIVKRPNYFLSELSMMALPITVEHASKAGSFDSPHRDPFDRMLAAQSLIENLGLVSVDDTFAVFGIQRIWLI
ncbi:MAG: type II toxin-antitoxin system VapC family toxin [Aestuariivita sp.]|nr:type II toxin-antitoxin system VapC family toxin [Aestuariivita sp.]MCY4203863.1 type II toxin-antitoxin system VapC family toxin [Aestuariivita sp.]